MNAAGDVRHKQSAVVEVEVNLAAVSVSEQLNIAFTRGFVASQAYVTRFNRNRSILPKRLPENTVGCVELPFDVQPFAVSRNPIIPTCGN